MLHRRLNERTAADIPCRGGTKPSTSDFASAWRDIGQSVAIGPCVALDEIDRLGTLSQWLADYRRQHAQYDALATTAILPLRPELFEVSFGGPPERQSAVHGPSA